MNVQKKKDDDDEEDLNDTNYDEVHWTPTWFIPEDISVTPMEEINPPWDSKDFLCGSNLIVRPCKPGEIKAWQ